MVGIHKQPNASHLSMSPKKCPQKIPNATTIAIGIEMSSTDKNISSFSKSGLFVAYILDDRAGGEEEKYLHGNLNHKATEICTYFL